MRFVLKVQLAAIGIIIVAGFLPTSARAGAQKDCGKIQEQELQHAEPNNWGRLYSLFKQFGECDDGALGEGFSEDVAQLLSKQWAHLDTLSRLTVADKKFEQFVLRHIDATLSNDELKAIANNSRLHCPTGEKRLCQLVRARAQSSIDELRNVTAQTLLPPRNGTKQQQAPGKKANTTDNAARTSVVAVENQPNSAQKEQGSQEKPKRILEKAFPPETWASWALFAAAVIAALIALFTLKAIHREAEEIKSVAKAANANSESIKHSERAWVQATPDMPGFALADPTAVGIFRWSIINTGRTPARIIEIAARYRLIQSLPRISATPEYEGDLERIPLHGMLLAPSQNYWSLQNLDPPSLTQDKLADIAAAKRILFAYGHVAYRDVFSKDTDTPRKTSFCYYYLVPQGALVGFIREGWRPYFQAPAAYTETT